MGSVPRVRLRPNEAVRTPQRETQKQSDPSRGWRSRSSQSPISRCRLRPSESPLVDALTHPVQFVFAPPEQDGGLAQVSSGYSEIRAPNGPSVPREHFALYLQWCCDDQEALEAIVPGATFGTPGSPCSQA